MANENKSGRADYQRKYYEDNRERLAEYKRRYYRDNRPSYAARERKYYQTPRRRAATLVSHARARAKKKGVAYDLGSRIDEIADILRNGRCAVSGLPFNLAGGRTWDSPSIDRIKPEKGYVWSNVQIVLWGVNVGKMNYSQDDYVRLCAAVAQTAIDSKQGLPLPKR